MYHLFSFFFFFIFILARFCWAEKITFSNADEFFLDTPIPTPYERVSLDLHSSISRIKSGSVTNLPSLWAFIGIHPETQLFVDVPAILADPKNRPKQYGYGDVRVGVKYRFLHDKERGIHMALYPKITFPSGDTNRGLGNGKWIGRFPIWVQKQLSDWRITAGGGYYINQASAKRNYPFGGVLIQWQVSPYLMLGNEVYAEGRISPTEKAKLVTNFGGSYFFDSNSFLTFSAGHSIAGARKFIAWLGWGIAWGPVTTR